MADLQIAGLGYLGVRAPALQAWAEFGSGILGMDLVCETSDELRFKMDERTYRVAVHRGEPGLAYIGWEVANERAFGAVLATLDREGVAYKEGDDAAARSVTSLIRCEDPSGTPLEFFFGPVVEEVRTVRSPHGVRFVTADQGMGHLVMTSSRYEESVEFYNRVLGFRITDDIVDAPASCSFMSTNPRHHTIAVAKAPVDVLHHFMVEVEDLVMVGQAHDRAIDGGVELSMSLGQHWNDHMISFYAVSPSGFSVEFGYGGRRIDASTWTRRRGNGEISFWGHRPPLGREIVAH